MDFHKTNRRMGTGDEQTGVLKLHNKFLEHSIPAIEKMSHPIKRQIVDEDKTAHALALHVFNSVK